MKIIEKILDLTTGDETIIERDETAGEKESRENLEAKFAAAAIINEEMLLAKKAVQSKLAALGLTTDDLKALGL